MRTHTASPTVEPATDDDLAAEPADLDCDELTSDAVEAIDADDTDAQAPDAEPDSDATDAQDGSSPRRLHIRRPRRAALVAMLVMALVMGGLVGWLGYLLHQAQQAADQRAEFVQAARQGAVNLTTIDWQHADADVQRVLDSATGTFYDDFAKRSKPFIDVVKQVQSKSEGTVTLAGLESVNGDQAQVLVAMSVKTTNTGAPEPSPRSWRMRIDVQKVGDSVKVSNVEFVP